MPLKSIDTQLSESAIDLNSACWEISTKEDRINEIERTTGYVHVTCAKDYLSVKIKELAEIEFVKISNGKIKSK